MKISLEKIKESAKETVQRFPITCIFTVLLMILGYVIIANLDESHHNFVIYATHFLAVNIFVSLFFELWREEVSNKGAINLAFGLAIVGVVVDTIAMSEAHFCAPVFLGRLSIFSAFIIGIVCVSFIKNKDDIQLWNFSTKVFGAFFSSAFITAVICGGLALLLFGVSELFSVKLKAEFYGNILMPFMVLLPVYLFLVRIPAGADKHNNNIQISKFISGVTRYLFIPLVSCYLLVLYVYLFKITFTWELPKGTISWMVSIMMLGFVIVVALLYPMLKKDDKPFDKWVAKWFPWLMLPLIALMSVGICRRISDYGITAPRLYVLLVNIWFYAVCIYLIITKSKRILWIPLSFCALFILSSAQPFNFHRITRNYMHSCVEKIIKEHQPAQIPMNRKEYDIWMSQFSEQEKENINERMFYLQRFEPDSQVEWLDFGISNRYYINYTAFDSNEIADGHSFIDFEYNLSNYYIDIPAGYTKFKKVFLHLQIDSTKIIAQRNDIGIDPIIIDTAILNKSHNNQVNLKAIHSDKIFVPTLVRFKSDGGGYYFDKDCDGYLFEK